MADNYYIKVELNDLLDDQSGYKTIGQPVQFFPSNGIEPPLNWARPYTAKYGPSIDHATQIWDSVSVEITDTEVIETFEAIDKPLDQLKSQLIAEVVTKRYGYENDGFYYDGNWYETNRDVRPILLSTSYVDGLTWKARNGSLVAHTSESFADLKTKINAAVQGAFIKEAYYTQLINAATTSAEVKAIDIEAGWPEVFYPTPAPAPVYLTPEEYDALHPLGPYGR